MPMQRAAGLFHVVTQQGNFGSSPKQRDAERLESRIPTGANGIGARRVYAITRMHEEQAEDIGRRSVARP